MSLTIVSTPIGHPEDITLRALETLKNCAVIICEELKPARVLLKKYGIANKELYQLNEHSKEKDIEALTALVQEKDAALISDCGTPGFNDPGAKLVNQCHRKNIKVDVNPGASSLMALIALSGYELKEFYFVGFLPAEREQRSKKVLTLKGSKIPYVIMDTPYRLQATLKDLASVHGDKTAVIGMDLTGPQHQLIVDKLNKLASKDWPKTPFILMVIP